MNHPPFKDRHDAGRQLALALLFLKGSTPVVLALPRGGVPVAYEVAKELNAPLDILLVRKIGAPFSPEFGIGAVADGSEEPVWNEAALANMYVSKDYLKTEQQRQIEEIARRRTLYCEGRPPLDVRDRTTVIVDDGVATGGTLRAALKSLRARKPKRLLFAVPVAPPAELKSLCAEADDGICLQSPEPFRAVSLYYDDFHQTSDEEVVELLHRAAREYGQSVSDDTPVSSVPSAEQKSSPPHSDRHSKQND